ncbi:MAG: hypothetical protein LBT52_04185 [Clostridiales Family XIII bacterium]|nr:hypothetical protein [Clostridiales Family XIII bacterium]
MKLSRRLKKRHVALCWLTALALVLTLAMPMSVSAADTVWQPPTQPMTPDPDIAKVGAHSAASTSVHYLGGDLVTMRQNEFNAITTAATPQLKLDAAMAYAALGTYGSLINDSPDPYWWNYFYNRYAEVNGLTPAPEDNIVLLYPASGPNAADVATSVNYGGTSATLSRRPDVLYGNDPVGGVGYDDLIADLPENNDSDLTNDYNPTQAPHKTQTIYEMSESLYGLANAMKLAGKNGRYGDPYTIAKQYEAYLKGIQYYVLSQLADGTITRKTVAIINPNLQAGGLYQAYDISMGMGTAATVRGAEYLENTADNLLTIESPTTSGTGVYLLTAAQVATADVIVAAGTQGTAKTANDIESDLLSQGVPPGSIPPILATAPVTTFGIVMNSPENIFGIPVFNGFVYPEVVNPMLDAMYLMENFWHIGNKQTLRSLAANAFQDASLPDGAAYHTPSFYNEDVVQEKIDEGLAYYTANKAAINAAYPKLEASDIDEVTLPDIAGAAVAAIANQTYDGTAKAPALTVTLLGKTLVAGKDYTAAYSSNVNVGKATVTLTGKGKYTGTKTASFNILAASTAITAPTAITVAKIADYIYTGKAITPGVKVTVGSKTLVKDTDYSVTYSGNINIGTATVTVTGKGNYSGTVKTTFKINPKKTAGFKLKAGKKAFTASWNKDAKVTGYQIWYSTDKKIAKSVKKTTVTKYTTVKKVVKKLKAKKTYYVKIRSYKTVSKVKYYSAWSTIKKIKTKK